MFRLLLGWVPVDLDVELGMNGSPHLSGECGFLDLVPLN